MSRSDVRCRFPPLFSFQSTSYLLLPPMRLLSGSIVYRLTTMPTKYSWDPDRPPSPPDHAIASKIAQIGQIGKCLETALNELLEEDQSGRVAEVEGNNSVADSGSNGSKDINNRKRDAMDESLSKSILQSYTDSVVNTSYDHRSKNFESRTSQTLTQTASATDPKTAPAALLTGEIQHYNRIGGQWRIIVKNATLLPRRVKSDAGLTRKRVMLDWDTAEGSSSGDEEAPNESERKKRRCDEQKPYKFDGRKRSGPSVGCRGGWVR
jgi:hypothetical protein